MTTMTSPRRTHPPQATAVAIWLAAWRAGSVPGRSSSGSISSHLFLHGAGVPVEILRDLGLARRAFADGQAAQQVVHHPVDPDRALVGVHAQVEHLVELAGDIVQPEGEL